MKSHRSQSIDALRALAALAVLFYHMKPEPPMTIGIPVYDQFLDFIGGWGRLGVDLFFILSGFCIHWGYSKPGAELETGKYLQRRWWRIYPPYFFALGFAVLLNLATNFYKLSSGGSFTWANFGLFQITSHVFLLHNLFKDSFTAISGPFWTIAVEMQFYLLYLVIRPLFFSKKGWSMAFLIALALQVVATVLDQGNSVFQPLNPFLYWIEWIAGAFIAYLLRRYPTLLHYWPVYLALTVGCFWGAVVSFHVNRLTFYWDNVQILVVLAFVFLVPLCIHFEKIWSWPGLRIMPFLGMFSYSIYLVHFLFLDRYRIFLIPKLAYGGVRLAASVLSAPVTLGLAYCFFVYFEKPFLEKSASIKTHQVPVNPECLN